MTSLKAATARECVNARQCVNARLRVCVYWEGVCVGLYVYLCVRACDRCSAEIQVQGIFQGLRSPFRATATCISVSACMSEAVRVNAHTLPHNDRPAPPQDGFQDANRPARALPACRVLCIPEACWATRL